MATDLLDKKDEKEGGDTDLKSFENEFAGRAGSPGFDEASKEMDNKSEGFYNPEDKDSGNSSGNKPKSKLKSIVQKRKKTLLIGGAGGGIVIILVVLLIFLSSLALPGFASDMLAYQFARVNRAFAEDNDQLAAEKASLESEDPTDPGSPIEDNAGVIKNFKDSTGELWDKMTGWTPSGTIKNLQKSGDLTYNYERTGLLQRQTLKSITIGDQELNLDTINPSKFSILKHPLQYVGDQVQAATDLRAGLDEALGEGPGITGIIVKGSIENSIREEASIPLYAWVLSKFSNKTPTQASAELDEEAQARIQQSGDPVPDCISNPICQAEEQGKDAIDSDSTDAENLAAIEANNGVDENEDNIVSGLLSKINSTLLAKASVVYAVAVPLCTIYDSSLQSPGAQTTIDNQDKEIERSFYFVESAADQQKAGDANATVVGAFNTKLGNLYDSNAEIRANGGTIDSLSSFQSPQAAPDGQYSIVNTFLPAWLAKLTNILLTNPIAGCSTLTNPHVAEGLLAAQIVAEIISSIPDAGAAGAAEESGSLGAGAAVDVAVDDAVDTGIGTTISNQLTSNAITGTILRASGKFAEKFSKKELAKLGVVSVATAGLSLVAKMDTLSKMGETYNGLSQGTDFANQADAGANFNSNEVERQEMYGAPLGPNDLAYNQAQDQQFIADQNSQKSFFDRYLAISNPESLVSKVGMNILGFVHGISIASVVNDAKGLLNPLKLASSLVGFFDHSKVSAATIEDNTDYGIVQWGYTQAEDALTNPTTGDPSYQPLENSHILFNSGQDNYIQSTYGPCYTDTLGQLLTQTPKSGPDTSDPYILRDSQGNVIGGLCSQKYLGPTSADPNAADGHYGNDLIFRWRLNNAYNNVIDQLEGIQNVST